ncbi:MAG: hypothetical protein ACLTYN_08010 [Dysosmobacter welbionis]
MLTIIAYYQPTTRPMGSDPGWTAYTIGLLLDRKLIEECGRLQHPEGPACTGPPNSFSGPSI